MVILTHGAKLIVNYKPTKLVFYGYGPELSSPAGECVVCISYRTTKSWVQDPGYSNANSKSELIRSEERNILKTLRIMREFFACVNLFGISKS